ncbi:MAG: metalloregulator ArsR/SmtB family transcription factor [Spirochaetaceae bacterium]|jgi:DNA-binding transcriptional ArsR family regulator|nr:metalloregulator ArsR/SmtB family transcription factor [Spirochaetaceae bacterium]
MDDIKKLQLIFHTLADQNRLRIIQAIDRKECTVSEITALLNLSQPLVSHHLKSLKNAGVLTTTRNGPFVIYRLKEPMILDLLGSFLDIFKGLDEETLGEQPSFITPLWWVEMRKKCFGGKPWE